MNKPARVLCVGGSDSGGGAGIQADLKAVAACGCYGMSVITAVTSQNTKGVQDIFPMPRRVIAAQLASVLSDIGADAVKTGMLFTEGAIRAVAESILAYRIEKLIVDPVMTAKGGRALMQTSAGRALTKKLLPLAYAVTPNVPEAEFLSGEKIRSIAAMKRAAVIIYQLGVKHVVIKGGHLPGSKSRGSIDLLYDGRKFYEFAADWIDTRDTHGTGCTYASLLACGLAEGIDMVQAVNEAKQMVTRAILQSLRLGEGHGPVNVLTIKH